MFFARSALAASLLAPCTLGLALGGFAALATPDTAAGQIVAPAGRTLFNRGVMVRGILRHDELETGRGGAEAERLRNVWAVVWGARPHLNLGLLVPFAHVEESGPGGGRSRTGAGDATLFARYDALRKVVPAGFTRLTPEVGAIVPTGGELGSGAAGWLAGLVASHVRDPDWWVADLQWSGFGEGDGGVEPGDRWRADLAYLRRVVPRDGPGTPMLLLVAELNYETRKRSRRDGRALPASGGHVLFLSPGVEWIATRRLVLELAVPIPVERGLRGTQPRPGTSVILGARWLF